MFKKIAAILLFLCSPVFGQDLTQYIITQEAGVPLTTNGTPLNLGDDNIALLPIGFDFVFFGQTFNTVYVSSNGFLSFTTPNNGCCSGQQLPSYIPNSIFAFWTDLISSLNPYWISTDSQFTVGWYNTFEYGTQNKYNFEITLFEGSNNILLNYASMGSVSYHTITAGIQGPDGEASQLFMLSPGDTPTSNTSYLFSTASVEEPCIASNTCVSDIINDIIQQDPVVVEETTVVEQVAENTNESTTEVVTQEMVATLAVETRAIEQVYSGSVGGVAAASPVTEVSTSTSSSQPADRSLLNRIMASNRAASLSSSFSDSSEAAAAAESPSLMTAGGNVAGVVSANDFGSALTLAMLDTGSTDIGSSEETSDASEDSESNNELAAGETTRLQSMSSNNAVLNNYSNMTMADLLIWYSSEQIYKQNQISDNLRSLYFMQKDSLDTYRKMVEEQYRR